MRKTLFLTLILITALSSLTYGGLVDGVITGISNNAKAAKDAAYQAFIKVKIVQQIAILKKNYDESKRFYDEMKSIADRPGGIGGYIQDGVEDRLTAIGEEAYWQFDADFIHTDGTNSAVKKWLTDTEKTVVKSLNFTQMIIEKSAERDKNIKNATARLASSDRKTVDQAKAEVDVLQLELLSSLEKNVAKTNELLAKQLAQEMRTTKMVYDQETKFSDQVQKIWQKSKRETVSNQRPYEQRVLEELRRTPN